MGFLDNLESSLKSLESREERDPREAEKRSSERTRDLAAAPWAEALKGSSYTKNLLDHSVVSGHRIRAKVYLAWVGSTLRLEARTRVLELRPTATGILASFTNAAGNTIERPVDLEGDPKALLDEWLAGEAPTVRPPLVLDEDTEAGEDGS